MSTLQPDEGDVSERELLVDDIQRIREALRVTADAVNKLSSEDEEDDEEDDEEFEEEEEEENEQPCAENASLKHQTSFKLPHQTDNFLSASKHGFTLTSEGEVLQEENCNGQEESNERTPLALTSVDNQGLISGLPFQAQVDTDSLTSQNHNFSSEEVILTELQPVCFQPPVCNLNTSQGGHTANSWPVELNQHHHQLQEEHGPQYNDDTDKELDCDYGMSSEIQQCLSLNRDYQLVILDELERIEHALKRNKQKQMGLHQMRANKDDTKPEPHTLIKFANPYFKDSSSLGPPDNDDTKVKRQSSQVGGYQIPSRCWNFKEQNSLAEGVRMQNLESKLSPVLQKIKKLEGKKEKTKRELKELEDLKAESVRIRNLGKETLERDLEDIDWDKLSSKYLPKRSGLECRLQWCNFGHPDVNRTAWTKEEDKKLIKLAKDPQNTWDIIAQKLQTKRTPIHCYERYQRSLNKNLLKSKWSPEDDQQLLEVVRIVGLGNWPRVASFLEGRHGDQCLHRYTQTLQMVRKGKWEKHEDELLKKAIDKYGPCNWSKLSDMVPGRSGPQCRERWVNALDPKIEKGPWTKEQDKDLLENVNKFGKGNWSKIARAMGNRTDNQCWRRWIVICKDDSLHYRQNTLRKRRELVANFTGRRQERPELEPEDLDIPDIPVVRKRKGRAPRPIEEARAMRRATQRKFREKKRAERREEERIRAEEEKAEKERKRAQKATINGGGDQIEAERMKVQEERPGKECKEGQKEANTGSEEDKFPRTRKAGGNRNRVQQPHHRVLMRDKQLSKRKQVAEKKEQRHTISSGGEKQVAVSGSLGPFSLLLQAFSIDIATVLKAIQQTGTTPSSVSSTSTSVGPNTGASVESKEVNSNEEQPQGQTCGGVERMEAQRETVGNETLNPDLHISTLDKQTSVVAKNHEEAEQSTDTESRVNKEKHSEISDTLELDNTDTESSLHKEIPDTRTNKEAPGPGENAHSGSDRVGALNKPPAAGSAVLASQAARRRAPAIPPLPPCYTTLKTYKSLQLLRPHLQKIAAMLKTVPRVSGTVSSTFGQSSSLNKSGSHGNEESSGTSGCGNEVTGANQPNRSNLVNKTDDNEGSLGGEIANDRDVSLENPLDKEGNNVSELNNESSISVGHEAKLLEGTETAAAQSRFNRNGKKETLSSENPSPSPMRVVTPTATVNEKGNGSSTTGFVTNGLVQSNRQQAETVIPLNNTSYRNSYEYRMLSSRFNSLFCWPALLSRIPVNRSSQIGPVFAERHPPPRGGIQSTKPKILTFRRKQRGLAAVRMASSASFSTPGQQMVSLGQGFAIKKNVPPTQPHKETSGSKDVVVAASQLLSLQESTRSLSLSTAKNRPCNTRQNKRKITPIKRYSNQECEAKKKKIVLSSDSYSSPSEDDDDDDDDDEDESDYVPGKEIRNVREFRPAPNTRRSSLRNMVPQTPKDSLSISSVQAGASSSTTGNVANNADEIIWDDHGNSIDHNTNETGPSFQGDINERVRQVEEVSEQDVSDVTRPQNNNTSISSSKGNAMPKRTGGARWRAMLPRVNDPGDTDVDTE